MFPPYLLKTLLHIGYQPPSSQLSLREQGLLAGSIGHPLSQHCWPKSTSYIFLTLLFLSPPLGLRKRLLAPPARFVPNTICETHALPRESHLQRTLQQRHDRW